MQLLFCFDVLARKVAWTCLLFRPNRIKVSLQNVRPPAVQKRLSPKGFKSQSHQTAGRTGSLQSWPTCLFVLRSCQATGFVGVVSRAQAVDSLSRFSSGLSIPFLSAVSDNYCSWLSLFAVRFLPFLAPCMK